MKKIFFLSAIALGLMTSCSEEEQLSLPSVDNNTIAFATQSANKPMTRSGATITSLSKFTVDAVNTDSSTVVAHKFAVAAKHAVDIVDIIVADDDMFNFALSFFDCNDTLTSYSLLWLEVAGTFHSLDRPP